jgi:hypothetical protein
MVERASRKLAWYDAVEDNLKHKFYMNLGQLDISDAPEERQPQVEYARKYWIWKKFGNITE